MSPEKESTRRWSVEARARGLGAALERDAPGQGRRARAPESAVLQRSFPAPLQQSRIAAGQGRAGQDRRLRRRLAAGEREDRYIRPPGRWFARSCRLRAYGRKKLGHRVSAPSNTSGQPRVRRGYLTSIHGDSDAIQIGEESSVRQTRRPGAENVALLRAPDPGDRSCTKRS
jgi:hypothetical protein